MDMNNDINFMLSGVMNDDGDNPEYISLLSQEEEEEINNEILP